MKRLWFLPFVLALTAPVLADTRPVTFDVAHATRWGESVYVLGDAPALGGGDVTRARRMVPGDNGRWTLTVALPEGSTYRYAYWIRNNDANAIADARNGWAVSAERADVVPGARASRQVRLRYLSGWAQVTVRYRQGPTRVADLLLNRIGSGRGAGEWIYEGTLVTDEAAPEFLLHDGAGGVDRAPGGGAYRTALSALTLADGRLHPGQLDPQALSGGSSRGRVVQVDGWYSNALGIARPILIYLPPGYDASNARYPVVYMHDGQNLFGPDALFGGWRAAETSDRLIAAGEVRPFIVVGVGNTGRRMSEYMPEADGGTARDYGRFLSDELKPWVDRSLRTLPGREDTAICGSSLGGLVSLYLGWERPDVFGQVASLSGSYWLRGFVDELVRSSARPSLRIWLDSGNQGNSADSLENTLFVRDTLLRKGYVLGRDVEHFVDFGMRRPTCAEGRGPWRPRRSAGRDRSCPAGPASRGAWPALRCAGPW
jgi:predicted alpha/beta superfamily hydrolase